LQSWFEGADRRGRHPVAHRGGTRWASTQQHQPHGGADMSEVMDQLIDLEAEEAVLDAVLLRPRYITGVLEVLAPEDFYRPWHAEIFKAMRDMHLAGEPI